MILRPFCVSHIHNTADVYLNILELFNLLMEKIKHYEEKLQNFFTCSLKFRRKSAGQFFYKPYLVF